MIYSIGVKASSVIGDSPPDSRETRPGGRIGDVAARLVPA